MGLGTGGWGAAGFAPPSTTQSHAGAELGHGQRWGGLRAFIAPPGIAILLLTPLLWGLPLRGVKPEQPAGLPPYSQPLCSPRSYEDFYLSCSLTHGGKELCSPLHTRKAHVYKYLFHLIIWDQQ